MINEIKNLVDLQKIDTRLGEIEIAKGGLPEKIAEIEKNQQELESAIAKNKERLQEIKKTLKKFDSEIADSTVTLVDYKKKLYLVTTNKEYDALQTQIDTIKETVRNNEDEQIKLEEEKARIDESLKVDELNLQTATEDYVIKKATLEKYIEQNASEEIRLKEEREGVTAKIKRKNLSYYNRFRLSTRAGLGIAHLERDACSACRYIVTAQDLIVIKRNDKLNSCSNCGVYLYHDEDED